MDFEYKEQYHFEDLLQAAVRLVVLAEAQLAARSVRRVETSC